MGREGERKALINWLSVLLPPDPPPSPFSTPTPIYPLSPRRATSTETQDPRASPAPGQYTARCQPECAAVRESECERDRGRERQTVKTTHIMEEPQPAPEATEDSPPPTGIQKALRALYVAFDIISKSLQWINDHMGNFNVYLFIKYLLASIVFYFVACASFGWVTLGIIYLVISHERKGKRDLRGALALADESTLKNIFAASMHEMPAWVSSPWPVSG